MTSLYISHSGQDRARAERIRGWLRAEGYQVLAVNGDQGQWSGGSGDRERQLYVILLQADGVVFLGTTASATSPWCAVELTLARSLGKPIFSLVSEGVSMPSLDETATIRPGEGGQAYARLSQALIDAGLGPGDIFDWNPARSPYPGLASFTEADTAVFYGRKAEIDQLIGLLTASGAQEPARLVAVVGPSGSGKSSLVQAGLLPLLRRGDRRGRWVLLPPMEPGDKPVENLARSLATAFQECGLRRDHEDLVLRLGGGPEELVGCAKDLCDVSPGRPALILLVIDQAEELVTLTGNEERAAFLDLLRGALDLEGSPLRVVATLRSEFLSSVLADPGIPRAIDAPLLLGPLNPAQLTEVITGPAIRAGLRFDPVLVQRMVADTQGGDALPLLAYTLRELSERSREQGGKPIGEEDYEALGGIVGILERQANAVEDGLRRAGLGELVLPTLMRLATVDGDNEPTRRRVRRGALSQAENQVVHAFIDARLLVSDRMGDGAAVQVAHEALLRQWPPLREAIEANREALRIRAELERLAQDWDRAGRRDSYLLGGERLETAQRWAAGHGELPLVLEFLDRSRRSDRAALLRASEAVARRALASVDRDPELCLLLALAAIEDYAPTPLAHQALLAALATPAVFAVLRGHHAAIWAVAWSPDGRRLATASADRTVRLWDAASGAELAVLRAHRNGVWGVAWSPDGRRLATVSGDRTVRLWDAASGAELAVLSGHRDAVWGVAWSPDGRWLATAAGDAADHSARIWDAERGEQVLVLDGHEDWVEGVAWSPDGRRLATASGDRTVRVWDATSGAELAVLRGHQDQARGVAWSPDGRRLASVSYDRTARVWDTASGAELAVLRGHGDAVRAVAWSPDGRRLATGSHDHTARIWDAELGRELEVLRGHQDGVRWVAWSADGRRLASASHDGTARVWDATDSGDVPVLRGQRDGLTGVAWSPDGQRLASASVDGTVQLWNPANASRTAILSGHADAVWAVAWSPDGQRLASASSDGTIRLWDPAAANEAMVLRGHPDAVRVVAWSPDGRRLASGSYDKTARIWDPSTGAELAVLRGHDDWVRAVAWSPDGRRLASGSYDKTARIWDPSTGQELAVLRGHHDAVWGIAWSPDGGRLATASHDRTARIWDPAVLAQLVLLHGHNGPIRAVTWSPDGQQLATASYDHTIEIWNPEQATEVLVLRGHHDVAEAVAWSPDGQWLASASEDGTVRVWDLVTAADLEALVAKARKRIFRRLTADERKNAMLNDPHCDLPAKHDGFTVCWYLGQCSAFRINHVSLASGETGVISFLTG